MSPPDNTAESKQLLKGLEPFLALLDASDDLCGIVDDNYCYRWVNQAYLNSLGRPRSAVENHAIPDILGADYFEQTVKPRMDGCLAGEVQRYETERDFPGLGRRSLLVCYYPIEVAGQHPPLIGAIITDVTQIRNTESKLARQADLLDMAGQIASFGGWFADLESNLVEWSDAVADIHGMPRGYTPKIAEAITYYAPEHRERIQERFNACAEHGTPYDEELQVIRTDGQRLWVRTSGEAVRDKDGRIVQIQGAFQNITSRHEREQELRKLAYIADQSPAPIAVTDLQGQIEYINPAFEQNSGFTRTELLGKTPARIKSGLTTDVSYQELWNTITAGRIWRGEIQNRRKDGSLYWEYEVISPLKDEQGQITNFVAIKEDITAFKQKERQLSAALAEVEDKQTRYRVLAEYSPDWDYWRDANGNYRYISPACETVCGYTANDFMHDPTLMERIVHPDDRVIWRQHLENVGSEKTRASHAPFEFRIIRSDDTIRWIEHACRAAYSPQGRYLGQRGVNRDVTSRKAAELELEQFALKDALTGLYSRNGFARQLHDRLNQHGWQPQSAVVIADIAGLRDINDTYGYDVGDKLLIKFSQRLLHYAGASGLAGRVGGDEFVLFLETKQDEVLETQLEQITATLAMPYRVIGTKIEIAFRAGYTCLGERHCSVQTLLREAERALFQHRLKSAVPWIAYSSRVQAEIQQRIDLTRELRTALKEGQLELHFQPQVDLTTGALVTCEALVRWNHPQRGLLLPGVFIPIAEQSQLIAPLGDWVLNRACQYLRDWRDMGLNPVSIAVNVSVIQFQTGDFATQVKKALQEFGLSPSDLTLEITETVFESESKTLLAQMDALRALGVKLSLDDFGTGYSSLSYLQKYQFDEIKIDQGFVFHLLDDPFNLHVIEAVIMLAKAMNAKVMGEGIESDTIARKLAARGCRQGQGFYYSMPLEAEDFQWLLEQRSNLPLTTNNA